MTEENKADLLLAAYEKSLDSLQAMRLVDTLSARSSLREDCSLFLRRLPEYPFGMDMGHNFRAFYDNSYCSRIWIFQEFLLAQRHVLQWGPHTISGYDFGNLKRLQCNQIYCGIKFADEERLDYFDLVFTRNQTTVLSDAREPYKMMSFTGTVLLLGYGECQDARDQVSGLMSLIYAESRNQIEIDYGRAWMKFSWTQYD